MIHQTAIVSPKAELHESVEVGPYAIIEDNVHVGEGSRILAHAQLASGARIGKNVSIYSGAIIGSIPQDLKFKGEETLANVGDNTTIREYVTVNRGTNYSGSTDVGENCLLMAYSHVAHDCKLADNIIMGNCTTLAGHVIIHSNVIISGLVPVHQFVKIGAHAMIGGGFRVPQDVCPYALIGGYPAKVTGLNIVGLKRRGFSDETIRTLRQAFKLLFNSNLNTTQAVTKIKEEIEIIPEVDEILKFIENSERGMIK